MISQFIQISTLRNYSICLLLSLFFTPSVSEAQTCTGNATTVTASTGVTNPSFATGNPNSASAELYDNADQIVLELSNTLTAGMSFTIRWRRAVGTQSPTIAVETSSDGTTYTAVSGSPFTLTQSVYVNQNITTTASVKYIRITSQNAFNTDLDAVTFDCTPFVPVSSATCVNTTEIGGSIFNDFNANGTFDFSATYDESGINGVAIAAYDNDDAIGNPTATTTSGNSGNYFLTGLTAGQTYRVEVTLPNTSLSTTNLYSCNSNTKLNKRFRNYLLCGTRPTFGELLKFPKRNCP